jgi:hypothetical protein
MNTNAYFLKVATHFILPEGIKLQISALFFATILGVIIKTDFFNFGISCTLDSFQSCTLQKLLILNRDGDTCFHSFHV